MRHIRVWEQIQVWEHRPAQIKAHIQVWEHKQAHIQVWEHRKAHIKAHIQVMEQYKSFYVRLSMTFFSPGPCLT